MLSLNRQVCALAQSSSQNFDITALYLKGVEGWLVAPRCDQGVPIPNSLEETFEVSGFETKISVWITWIYVSNSVKLVNSVGNLHLIFILGQIQCNNDRNSRLRQCKRVGYVQAATMLLYYLSSSICHS